MAKNFANAGSAKVFDAAKKASAKADVITVKMIDTANLVDYPYNNEDITDTTDLENSMRELGFTDPIEVTSYTQKEGEYMIVSGHRRRAAGLKCGITTFPCIVKHFTSDADVHNYVLLANSQRDTAKDALLFCKRYKMHESYLRDIEFKGSIREEIAKRMGLSVQQADRYAAMGKLIEPVLDMVLADDVGMSSVLPLASHTAEEQSEIHTIMLCAAGAGISLTRDTVKKIVDGYRSGRKTWAAICSADSDDLHNGLFLNGDMYHESEPACDSNDRSNRNDEVRRERDFIAENEDAMDADREQFESDQQSTHGEDDDSAALDDLAADFSKSSNSSASSVPAEIKNGEKVAKGLISLQNCFNEIYDFNSDDDTMAVVRDMKSLIVMMLDEAHDLCHSAKSTDFFDSFVRDVVTKCKEF